MPRHVATIVEMSRILRWVNYTLLGLALALVCSVYWFVWRATPKVSGALRSPVQKEVTIARDGLGVPHVVAQSIDDALFAQGFATAQDRLWQMDSLRRLAAGELSEVVGQAALELDLKSRRLRMRRISAAWARTMPAESKAYLAAYARGVNHYIETNRGHWGPEFALMRYEPRPWLIEDSLLCALQMHRTLSGDWESDLARFKLRSAGERDKVDALFPTRSGDEPKPGSNAWAIAGSRTTTGKPVLANDPHLEWSMPSTWYMVHLKAPGLNVVGAALPGVPGVTIGHNERIAWGITALQFDNMDLYSESLEAGSGRYRLDGRQLAAAREVEWIAVRGSKPVEVVNLLTVHGPIVSSENGLHLALKWAAADGREFVFPMIELNRAGNWTEFRSALSKMVGPNVNAIYADVDGNIGWQVAGRCPIRKGFDGGTVLDGASGAQEWSGYVPFEQLPSYFNPASGMVVSANQNSFPEGTPYPVGGFFASPHRATQITGALKSRAKWQPAEMLGVQRDVYSGFLRFLARSAVAAVARRKDSNPMALEGVAILKDWDGQADKDRAAPLLATLLYQHLRRAVVERAAPKQGGNLRTFMAPSVVERLLRDRPPGWFDDYDQLLATELADAVEEARRMQGRNSAGWKFGRMNELTIAHPVASRIPWISAYFNIGPVAISGTGTSINAATPRLGPSMRFVADLSNWDESRMNLTAGESGHILSGHYKDQWKAYQSGASFRLEFRTVDARETLSLRP